MAGLLPILLLSIMNATAFSAGATSFASGSVIPKEFTCKGADLRPEIHWSGAPSSTKSFAIIVSDPDAPDPANPKTIWTHWIAYNIPPTITSIPEKSALPTGAICGLNDWANAKWNGPCPSIGTHRYFFNVYALDTKLTFKSPPDRLTIENAMKEHIVSTAEFIGLSSDIE